MSDIQLGTILQKDDEHILEKYFEAALWCNANQGAIEEQDDHYVIVERHIESIEEPERDGILRTYLARLEGIKHGMMATLAMGRDITKLQAQYQAVQEEMTMKLRDTKKQ